MTSLDQPSEPFVQRNAWILLAAVSAIFISFGLGDLALGGNADPAIAESIVGVEWETIQASAPEFARFINLSSRILGLTLLSASVLTLAIILTAFRRGEAWAWFVLWIWPIWNASVFALTYTAERSPDFPPPPPMMSAPILFVITAAALLLSFRKFFPGTRSAGQ